MSGNTDFWSRVAAKLLEFARADPAHAIDRFTDNWRLNDGQRASLHALAERLPSNGVVIADEVGMGKTRLAAAVVRAVTECGGRVAIVVPPGLGFQWNEELRDAGVEPKRVLRSLWQYFEAWSHEDPGRHVAWSGVPVLLISQLLANWRLGASSQAWRWTLVPEVYARWRAHSTGRLPRKFWENRDKQVLGDAWVEASAAHIVAQAQGDPELEAYLDSLLKYPWTQTLVPKMYEKHGALRPYFERLIGLGLGAFDLMVIDEAHKGRGADSSLSRLLESALSLKPHARRLGLTATPVELDPGQWKGTLARIGAGGEDVESAITTFAEAVRKVRMRPSDPATRESYFASARRFKDTLSPYLLRRDKREDEAVRLFAARSNLGFHAYRREHEVVVDPEAISLPWRRAVCAAEALSHMTIVETDDQRAKRLRLTIGNGHGIATLVDQRWEDAAKDRVDESGEQPSAPAKDDAPEPTDKRSMRLRWWRGVLESVLDGGEGALYLHPGVLAAVEKIESLTARNEKVLVFGRYTRPLRALVELLNAREMLRAIGGGQPWAQAKVPEREWTAVQVAHRQLGFSWPLSRAELDARLEAQYSQLESRRERFRDGLLERLEEGLSSRPASSIERVLFDAFAKSAGQPGNAVLQQVARALQAAFGNEADEVSSKHLAEAFGDLIGVLRARDEGDEDGNGELEASEAETLWPTLATRLDEEYSRAEGDFARLMFGETKPETRRLLQLAFNRPHSMPRVLVAQSMVGREGLNLHRACRHVLLLHPEWNPGVVEQQIGRIDRVGSRWAQQCRAAIESGASGESLPRIEILPVVFKGTYDEQNWSVLRQRWEDLRAQLHGVVIPQSEAIAYAHLDGVLEAINSAAPNFSPVAWKDRTNGNQKF